MKSDDLDRNANGVGVYIECHARVGVWGTPTFFINRRKFLPSAYGVDAFSAVIDKHTLKKAP